MIGMRSVRAVAFAGALAVSGCGGGAEGPGGPGGGGMPPTPVETAKASIRVVSDIFTTVGTLEAAEMVEIVAEIDGKVVRAPFREGERIAKGAVVAQLDDEALEAEYRRAEALRDQRKATYDRVKHVVEAKAGAPQDLDDAHAALRVADAEAALARVRLSKARILAPFDGVIGPRSVSPGSYVRAGESIAELAQISEMKVRFTLPERYLAEVRRGAEVAVVTPAFPDREVTGRVDVVDPIVDPDTRNVRVIARVPNPDARLLPGLSADVRLVMAQRDSALTVPAEAVIGEGSQFFVYEVAEDGSVARATVRLGTRLADAVEIVAGLEPGDIVVRAGHQKLYPGAKVMPVGEGAPGAPGQAPGDAAGGGAAAAAGEDAAAAEQPAEGAHTP